MNNPSVTIVVPVYNVETYLKQCLDSIFNQTYQNFEIIAIEDRSTDESYSVLCDYNNSLTSEQKSKLRILRNEKNSGLSYNRNAGLEIARGDFICFVDSDDYLSPEYLEYLLHLQKKHDSDVCMCLKYCIDARNNDQNITYSYRHIYKFLIESGIETDYVTERKDLVKFPLLYENHVQNKLIRTSFLRKYNIKFPVGVLFEDFLWMIQITAHCNSITMGFDEQYHYRYFRSGSIIDISHRKGIQGPLDILMSSEKGLEYYNSNNLFLDESIYSAYLKLNKVFVYGAYINYNNAEEDKDKVLDYYNRMRAINKKIIDAQPNPEEFKEKNKELLSEFKYIS